MRHALTLLCATLLCATLLASGCGPVEPDPACAGYVQCMDARDRALGMHTNVASYGEHGACWQNADNAEHCATACLHGLAWVRQTEAQLPAECAE